MLPRQFGLPFAAILPLVRGHGVILNAQGEAGSPASVGFQVDTALARNCTSISPCQQDTTIIRDAEIASNVVNECGRTELTGNIDVGENTENALAAKAVTQVKAGTQMTVTIHQVNADGAGPYSCDLDETGNTGVISQNLSVTNNVPGANGLSQAKTQDFNITVTMPNNFTCTGASTGNVCTVRCRNNAVAGPFGGCFAVQQVGTKAKVNTPANINTVSSLDTVLSQVQQNQADLSAAVAANQKAGTGEAVQNLKDVNALLALSVVSSASPVQTPKVALGANGVTASRAAATSAAATNNSNNTAANGKKSKGNKGGNAAGANANANAKANGNTKNGNGNSRNGNNKRMRALGSAMKYVKAGQEFTEGEP